MLTVPPGDECRAVFAQNLVKRISDCVIFLFLFWYNENRLRCISLFTPRRDEVPS